MELTTQRRGRETSLTLPQASPQGCTAGSSESRGQWLATLKNPDSNGYGVVVRYGKPEDFLRKFSPAMQCRYTEKPEWTFAEHSPVLARVKVGYGYDIAEAWVEAQVLDLLAFTGVKGLLCEAQARQLSGVIVGCFYYLSVTEIMDFFKKFKAGQYGKFYGSVDPLAITEALNKYSDWAAAERERVRARQAINAKVAMMGEARAEHAKFRKLLEEKGITTAEYLFLSSLGKSSLLGGMTKDEVRDLITKMEGDKENEKKKGRAQDVALLVSSE